MKTGPLFFSYMALSESAVWGQKTKINKSFLRRKFLARAQREKSNKKHYSSVRAISRNFSRQDQKGDAEPNG